MELFQGSRIEDQRCFLPGTPNIGNGHIPSGGASAAIAFDRHAPVMPPPPPKAPTVPDEDFFSLIMKLQSGRMEDQRSSLPRNPGNLNKPGFSSSLGRSDSSSIVSGAVALSRAEHDQDLPGRELEKNSSVPKLIRVTKK